MLSVTKSYLPPLEDYISYLQQIWSSHELTNGSRLSKLLEERLKKFLNVRHFLYTGNGTISLQIAIKALALKKEIMTTPFSYVATSNSILWEHCKPKFVDIEKHSFGIDASLIEKSIGPDTEAILGVHVYGYPCDVDGIQDVASKHGLKVIYDGAHAMGVQYRGKSLLSYGDISTLSFHATKAFHTAEGGAVITHSDELAERMSLLRNFGHRSDQYLSEGINAKNSEFHAALGLCNLDHFAENTKIRKHIFELYNQQLEGLPLRILNPNSDLEYNYSYYVLVFESEPQLLKSMKLLALQSVFPRRYFFPSLNTLSFYEPQSCPVSEDFARRVLCLPLSVYLTEAQVETVCTTLKKSFSL